MVTDNTEEEKNNPRSRVDTREAVVQRQSQPQPCQGERGHGQYHEPERVAHGLQKDGVMKQARVVLGADELRAAKQVGFVEAQPEAR